MSIAENIAVLRNTIPRHVTIIAVSKTMSTANIMQAYEAGQKIFGENRVQELIRKKQELPEDIDWHLIGHLQTNKVKYVVPFVRLIHSVDSLKLLSALNHEASVIKRKVDCLLQIRIAREESKFGMSFAAAEQVLCSNEFRDFQNIRVTGLMGMATLTDNIGQIREEFLLLARFFGELKARTFLHDQSFKELSMGMSGDFKIAIEAGSTMVRIGSLIFGERD